MMAGAVLVQNTAWLGANKAVEQLEEAGLLTSWSRLLSTPEETVWALIRPAGFFRVKTVRLRALAHFMVVSGGHEALFSLQTSELRQALLGVHGVGKETADSILCYAADRPVFVVDAYTKRIFLRLGWITPTATYETMQQLVHKNFPVETQPLGELHALLVRHAKDHCRVKPSCAGCPVLFCPAS